MLEALGKFLGLDFCPHSIIPVTWGILQSFEAYSTVNCQLKIKSMCSCISQYEYYYSQVVCDENMVLLDVLAGWPGSVHDSRVLHNSSVSLQANNRLPNDTHSLGDGGYPLST